VSFAVNIAEANFEEKSIYSNSKHYFAMKNKEKN
jgi:hypothetical protein